MEQVAQRYITVAAAGIATGGVMAAIALATPSLPDVQVRDFGLAASLQIGPDLQIETVENHIRPDLAGTGDVDHSQGALSDLLFNRGTGTFDGLSDPTSNTSDFTLDQNDLTNLLGGGFDPEAIRQGVILDPLTTDVALPGAGGAAGGAFGANDASAGANAASAAASAIVGLGQSLPMAQQALTSGVAAAELQFNSALAEAQATAVERFGANSDAAEFVNWMFHVNNSVIAQNEASLNSLLGVDLNSASIQDSLLSHLAPGGAAAEQAWNALLALNPDEYADVIQAVQANSFTVLLGNLDWSSLFPGLF